MSSSETPAAKKRGVPWWGWAIIGVVALAVVSSSLSGGSDGIESGTIADESTQSPADEAAPAVEQDVNPNESMGEKNARESAQSYLRFQAFSKQGLIDQLEFEGFTTAEAEYAVDAVNADWSEQAKKSAQSYLSFQSFSESGLISQLEFEGFTAEEAQFGVTANNVDWNEQAAKSAESYLSFQSFSKQGLIDQLIFEGFTQSQAEYGVSQNGF